MKRTFGVGIVGTGSIADMHADAANSLDDTRLVACYNHHLEKGEAFARRYGIRCHSSLEAFMADPEIDIVAVTTPSKSHLEPCLAAIDHGKALLVEKPLEATTERCDRIIAAAKAKGTVLAGIFQSRFFDSSRLVREAIDSGRFGRLVLLDAQFKWYRSQEYYDSVPWRGDMEVGGGGVLMNQGIHAPPARRCASRAEPWASSRAQSPPGPASPSVSSSAARRVRPYLRTRRSRPGPSRTRGQRTTRSVAATPHPRAREAAPIRWRSPQVATWPTSRIWSTA